MLGQPRPSLLIAAFGPFPGTPDNPAEAAVRRLESRSFAPGGTTVSYSILPTTWQGAFPALARAVAEADADAVLIVGVAGESDAFRVESVARNRVGPERVDAAGDRSAAASVSAGGPDTIVAACDTGPIIKAISREGLACRLSEDAGDYLCNHTFYRALTELPPNRPTTAFLHVPALGSRVGIEDIVRAVQAAAGALAPQTGRT
jgi:pyroglutamyl-peptidase